GADRSGGGAGSMIAEAGVLSRPPLSCRTSPPQGGRSAASRPSPSLQRRRLAKAVQSPDLPPCGGEVRQDRGGQRGAQASASTSAQANPCPPCPHSRLISSRCFPNAGPG